MYQFKNIIQLIGNVSTPNIEVHENGFKLAVFKLRTTDQYWTESGIKTKGDMLHTCKANNKLAEIVERYIFDGAEIAVEGSLIQPQANDPLGNLPYIQISDLLILRKG
jgi:single-stranded DNA-binding protein